jgi:parallel beta-helix repeat protein
VIKGNVDVGVITFDSEVEIRGNQISGSQGNPSGTGRGLEVQNSKALILSNTISENTETGVTLFFRSSVELVGNTIQNNGCGLYVDPDVTLSEGNNTWEGNRRGNRCN